MKKQGTIEVEETFDEQSYLDSKEYTNLVSELKALSGKDRQVYWFGKRLFDFVFGLLFLILLSPLLLIIAIIIFIDDPHGAPIYSQVRVGRKGKLFRFFKFRSMVVNADELQESLLDKNERKGPMFKIKDDPRVTRVGHFIRRTSIDELPQLLNIVLGDMSFVGPRPSLPKEVAQFNDFQKQRLLVTPGLTCYWQVTPHREDISFDEQVDMDIKYIIDRS